MPIFFHPIEEAVVDLAHHAEDISPEALDSLVVGALPGLPVETVSVIRVAVDVQQELTTTSTLPSRAIHSNMFSCNYFMLGSSSSAKIIPTTEEACSILRIKYSRSSEEQDSLLYPLTFSDLLFHIFHKRNYGVSCHWGLLTI
jgi:hypothetical protein